LGKLRARRREFHDEKPPPAQRGMCDGDCVKASITASSVLEKVPPL